MTTLNLQPYIDGTYDILAFRGTKIAGEFLTDQSLADEQSSGQLTTGIQKMSQRFLLRLLTERGTMTYRPDEGTDFMRRLRLGQIRTEDALRSAFVIAEIRIKAQFGRDERDDDPAEELYDRATLTGVIIFPGFANLGIELRSRAEQAQLVLPVPIVI